MMSLMKSQYLKRKYAFRLKYGKPTTDELKSGDGQMMSDYLGLVMSLGEYKNAHRKNMQSRKYQAKYRDNNREKYRTYHRNWKRKLRGKPVDVH
tara:strand:+ start:2104 stop:2385 length:282 start_codon:yes stop_codon:yes gene_type:complete